MIASAAYICSRYSLTTSFSITHRPFCFSTHFIQARQPRTVFPPICRYSVLQPAASRGSSTFLSIISVLPPGLGLPFMAIAFMMVSSDLFFLTLLIFKNHLLFGIAGQPEDNDVRHGI